MAEPLIAEDLLLLLLDDEKGTTSSWVSVQTVLGGAVLAELGLRGLVTVEEEPSAWRSAKVRATGAAADDRVLDGALATVAEKPRAASDLVDRIGKGLQDTLAERLVERGVLEREDSKVLGIFSRTRWPAADIVRETEVRRTLAAVLLEGQEPDERTRALVALLRAVDRAHQEVERGGVPAEDVKRRAKELADGDWASKAVKDAVEASMAAVVAATAATTAATSAST